METYKKILKQFIEFKSISTDMHYKNACFQTAIWLEELFRSYSFSVKLIENGQCNPVIFAEYNCRAEETVCIYGHYDVQPTDGQPWTSDPFLVREDESYIYGRGIVDNKGQVLVHMSAVFDAIKSKTLKKNVIFVIEGNEESGNPVLPEILKNNLPDTISYTIISDGEIVGDYPTIESSLRGGANMKIILKTAATDVHSGLFGGAIPNAIQELVKLLSLVKDKNNNIVIPNFYNDICDFPDVLTPSRLGLGSKLLLDSLGIKKTLLEKGKDFYEQVGQFPTLTITGISGGYTGSGFANIVPCIGEARLNVRTVAGQDTNKILLSIKNFLTEHVPEYCTISIDTTDGYDPVLLDVGNEVISKIESKLFNSFGKKVVYKFVGGGIPIVNDFLNITQKPVVLVSLGNEDCNMHGHDEKFNKDILKKSLVFTNDFWTSK